MASIRIPFISASGTRRFWTAQGLTWTGYGLLFAVMLRFYIPWADIVLARAFMAAATGCACTTGLHWFYTRIQWPDRRPIWLAFIVVIASLVVGLVWDALSATGGDLLDPFATKYTDYMNPGYEMPLIDRPAMFPVVVLLWSLGYLGVRQRAARQRQREHLLKADALAHQARLQMLRYQLNPHFLFNALNSISALADEEPARVKAMVHELSSFLRYSLLDPDTFDVPLRDELRAARHYLAIEQIRFEEDLEVTWAVAPEAEEHIVPAFLVLPLVENAVKHGQMTSPMPLRIRLAGQRHGDRISLEVANTGVWMDAESALPSEMPGTGTGLRNVRERLQEQYPDRYRFVHYEQDGWVHVRIDLYDHTQTTL